MPQLDSDSFAYSNGNLASVSSGKWTDLSSVNPLTVTSNKVSGSVEAMGVITTWSGSTTDQYAQVTLDTVGVDGTGPTVRSNAVYTCYLLVCKLSGNDTKIFRVVGGTYTQLSAADVAWATGDVAYLEIQGSQLLVKRNGSTQSALTVTDGSPIVSGKPGANAVTDTISAWAAGDFGGATPFVMQLGYQRM